MLLYRLGVQQKPGHVLSRGDTTRGAFSKPSSASRIYSGPVSCRRRACQHGAVPSTSREDGERGTVGIYSGWDEGAT
jgi:hypothetical protein